ncbi:MAG TPA: carbohydrate porin [Planctomycetaceae bacterium]|nr:carbohydrate porin [Planctomycetaceae bacterium]
MRSLVRASGIVLVFSAMAASGRCDDLRLEILDPPPPAAPPAGSAQAAAPSTSSLTAQGQACEGLGQAPTCTPSPFDGDCCTRPYLLGSLCGVRDQLAAHGITFSVQNYNFYQGVATGGIHDVGDYSGRDDYFVNIDGEKLGLWKGFFVTLHGETRYGDTVNGDTGALIPVNMPELSPKAKGSETALTAVKFTQALSENFVTFAGKLNMFDEFTMPFTGARLFDGFWNLGMSFPLVVARTVPYSTLGAGAAVLQDGVPVFTVMVLDTNNTPTTSGFDTLFSNGATIFANLTVPTKFFGLGGSQGVSGTFGTGNYNSLSPTAYFDPEQGLVIVPEFVRDSWCVFYTGTQELWADPKNAKHAYGVYTNIGVADDGPSPIRFTANAALYGSSPISNRPLDTFGVGYAITRYSSPVRDFAPVLLPLDNDQAIELFYTVAVTPYCHVTPDLQVVFPARDRTFPPNAQNIDTALVLGINAKIDF